MNSFDILIIVITIFFVLRGWIKGFFQEVFSLILIFLTFYISFKYYYQLSILINKIVGILAINKIVAFVILFLLGSLISTIIKNYIIVHLENIEFINFLNKILGAITGFLIGVLITFGISYFIMFFLDPSILQKSKVFPYYEKIFNYLIGYIK